MNILGVTRLLVVHIKMSSKSRYISDVQKREFCIEDIHLEVISVDMTFKAIRQVEITE